MKTIEPHGSWPSNLTPRLVAAAGTRLGGARLDQSGRVLWWEGRPAEAGRGVVVARTPDGATTEVTPPGSNVRSRVHEYDGGSWTVLADSSVAYVNNADQNIYLAGLDGTVVQLTEGDDTVRYGDLTPAPTGLLAVRETHGAGGTEPVNDLVVIDTASGEVTSLASGRDFYSSPRPSPDGLRIAYICWDHPNMPWDETELRVMDLSGEGLVDTVMLTGWSTQQPIWIGGELHAITDPTGYWLPHRIDAPNSYSALVDVECDLGVPPWVFGMCTICTDGDQLFVIAQIEGTERLARIVDGHLELVDCDRLAFDSMAPAGAGRVVVCASSALRPSEVLVIDAAGATQTVVRVDPVLGPGDVSPARHITFTSGTRTAHGLFYEPRSTVASAPEGELAPLVVLSHGGPTSAARAGLNLAIQFWTQRGFAVVDVNYGGSTGYGTEFRRALDGQWGVVDVEDCIAAARHLADHGLVDPARWVIKGGSAGGYTTLCALTFHDAFAAGISRYGIGDLEALAHDTHKFEARYIDGLVGPYPERADLYRQRSPIHHTHLLTTPMLILQGDEDPVVPPNQARAMADALAERSIPHALLMFEGESHGFRRAETIIRAVEAEYVFACQIFGIEPSGDFAPVDLVS
ncbi:MAG: S9 family peptidase [Acidimicrobiales bacterium]